MGSLSPAHWLIVIVVLVLLFGAKRLPDVARSLGRSARILKAEVGEISDGGRTENDRAARGGESGEDLPR
jgi:sec-independent protein translocase protein TatA